MRCKCKSVGFSNHWFKPYLKTAQNWLNLAIKTEKYTQRGNHTFLPKPWYSMNEKTDLIYYDFRKGIIIPDAFFVLDGTVLISSRESSGAFLMASWMLSPLLSR